MFDLDDKKYSFFSSSSILYVLSTILVITIGIIYMNNSNNKNNNRKKNNSKNNKISLSSSSNPASDWGLNKWIPPRERRQYIEKKRIIIEKRDTIKTEEDNKILCDALLKRAISEIPVILEVQSQTQIDNDNYNDNEEQQNSYENDKTFMEKKKFVDDEIEDIKKEAEELLPGWGVQIWAQSMQLHKALEGHNKKIKKKKQK